MEHVAGLPVADGAVCEVYLYPDKYAFKYDEAIYSLSFDRIKDVSIKTETELDSHVSSVSGISERALFSCSVGRTGRKTDNTATRFLVFTYDKDGVTSFVVFDSTGLRAASKFIEAFHKTDKRKATVEL